MQPITLSPLHQAIIKALLYADIFNHPLTANEIAEFSSHPQTNIQQVEAALPHLLAKGLIFACKNFYGLKAYPDIEKMVADRLIGNQRAEKILPLAFRISKFIGSFPFVRGVLLSGSLSKNRLAADGDIDYFIIAQPNRLWLTRTLFVGFKKLFLFNSHKYFCVNYFIDTNHLQIEEQNLFSATELITLLPTYGQLLYPKFWQANNWVKQYYPNSAPRPYTHLPIGKGNWLKNGMEWVLNKTIASRIDKWCMQKTIKHWVKNYSAQIEADDFKIAFKSTTYTSKHHPNQFQKKVLEKLNEKIANYEVVHQLSLNSTI
jgi:hypothetical protein